MLGISWGVNETRVPIFWITVETGIGRPGDHVYGGLETLLLCFDVLLRTYVREVLGVVELVILGWRNGIEGGWVCGISRQCLCCM